jgi:hypothetical protein
MHCHERDERVVGGEAMDRNVRRNCAAKVSRSHKKTEGAGAWEQ